MVEVTEIHAVDYRHACVTSGSASYTLSLMTSHMPPSLLWFSISSLLTIAVSGVDTPTVLHKLQWSAIIGYCMQTKNWPDMPMYTILGYGFDSISRCLKYHTAFLNSPVCVRFVQAKSSTSMMCTPGAHLLNWSNRLINFPSNGTHFVVTITGATFICSNTNPSVNSGNNEPRRERNNIS